MTITWAIARQTIAEGIRMKIALVFLVLIGVVVLGLPFSIAGDASVTGAVQSFLSYALSTMAVLLGMLTIFMSRSLSDELVQRHVFLVLTKPVPRWQFILGKWLGITVLNLVFLSFAGLSMYGMVHYIQRNHPPIDDRYDMAELQHEVLVARHALSAILPDFTRPAEAEFERNLEEGLYSSLPDFNAGEEKRRLAKKYEARWRVVGPLDTRVFEFENVLCDRSADHEIQIRYRTDVSRYPPDEVFRALWRIGNPLKDTPVYNLPVRHIVGRYHTVPVAADAVARDHTLTVRFFNHNPFEGEPQFRSVIEFRKSEPVEVLFVVGSFEGNLFRLFVIMMCKLMVLAAVALLAATLFSFPVACLASFTVYILAGSRAFIYESLDLASSDAATMFTSVKEFMIHLIVLVYDAIAWVIPDFARYDAVETLVNGRNVSLVWVLQAVSDLVLIKTVLALGLAMLLFHRREVAEVSV